MMNAIRLADHTQTDFRFHWPADIWNPVYDQVTRDVKPQILGQSITAQEKVFSQSFIDANALTYVVEADVAPFPKSGLTEEDIAKADLLGWYTDRWYLDTICDPAYAARCRMSSQEAFERIEFSPYLRQVIAHVRAMDLEPFTALHLRSGDLVYGDLRRWGFWGDKVINPIVARDIIANLTAQGRKVIVFGQDKACLAQLEALPGVELARRRVADLGDDLLTQSIAEIMLMSRADEIISGDSGFSRTASMIAGKRVKSMFSLYSPVAYSDVTLKGLETVDLHPLMGAYSAWQAYAFGRQLRSVPQLIAIIEKACDLDPDNLHHLLIKASLLYRLGEDAAAEAVLAERLSLSEGDKVSSNHPLIRQLLFRYGTPKFTHAEQFDDFVAAARRPGNARAVLLRPFIASREKLSGLTT